MKCALVLALLGLIACQEPRLELPLVCAHTSQCPSGYHCSPGGTCTGDVGCSSDAECCLGERCEQKRCRPRQMCSLQSPCGKVGDVCLGDLCVPRPCGATQACPSSATTCLWGRCQDHVPCGGHCGEGEACAVLIDRCVALQDAHLQCPPGQLRVLSNDADLLAEGCRLRPELTACQALPPLPEGRIGVPGVLVPIQGGLAHVAYDQTYGDIVLGRYRTAPPLDRVELRVLTGLPQTGTVVGAVTGPRGGVAEPGPDRGESLDAMADGKGHIAVAYRDKSADSVRYLELANDGKVVRDVGVRQEAGIGRAVAVTWLPGGLPAILTFTPASASSASHLRLFTAISATPQGEADWKAQELDTEPLAADPTPCGVPCPPDRVCAQDGPAESCVIPEASCGLCLPSQVCHGGTCRTRKLPAPALDDVAQGRGAWLDLAATAGGAIVAAAYSPKSRDLAIYRGAIGTAFSKSVVTGQAVGSQDVGRFVSLLLDPGGKAWLACEDSDLGRLLLVRELGPGKGFAIDVLDDGNRPDGHHRVGADAALLRHPAGGVLAVAQDVRRADLVLVRVPVPGGAQVQRSVLVATDAAGFANSLVAVGSKAFVAASTTWQVQPDGTVRSRVVLSDVVWSGE